MRILVFCQYYYPEPFRVTDLCEELAQRGHEVTVVTGEPNYPEGKIYSGYERRQREDEIINGVRVHRCHIIPRKSGAVYRFLNYFSYPFAAKRYVKSLARQDNETYDVVLVNQLSPVMMASPALAYKKRYGTPIVLYCLDLWPESLVAGGVKRNSFIYRIFHRISKKIYRSVDRILVTSKSFLKYLVNEFGVDESRVDYLPQYAEGIFKRIEYREPCGDINLVFAGNIGAAQSVETIIQAADLLKGKQVQFHIVGGGSDLERLKKLASGLDNVTFYGRRPLDEMPMFYAKADAMLITLQDDPVLSLTLPGKVQSYMACGKPIIGAIDGETKITIDEAKCGYCGHAQDFNSLVENIERFIDNPRKDELANNSFDYYKKHFDRNIFIDRIEKELRSWITT